MREFKELYKKVDGTNIIRQYRRSRVLAYAFLMACILGTSRKSLEIVRLVVNKRMLDKLRRRYKKFIEAFCKCNDCKQDDPQIQEERKVWICWFQGIENAPQIVRKCYQSLKLNITDRQIVLITEENYKEYVSFPEEIQKKMDRRIISGAHMADLLRLELLSRYGGTWIDATILCTGECPLYMLDADLFVFQNLKPGLNGAATCASNWFITARPGNKIINLTLALLYEYWGKYNRLNDYFIFHKFFQLAIETYPEEWSRVVPVNNSTPHILLLRLFEQYDNEIWQAIKEQTPFHKLSYKFDEGESNRSGTYYDSIINKEET